MKRRQFISALASMVVWPRYVSSQSALPVIGFLNTASREAFIPHVDAFKKGLSEAGIVEGANVAIEFRWAEGRRELLIEMANELAHRRVNVIAATGGSPAALAAQAATKTIPIVFQVGVDPVEAGLVTSMNKPGGNMTGTTMLALELGSKRLEMLSQILPSRALIGALVNPTGPGFTTLMRDLMSAASSLGLRLHVANASAEAEISSAFAELKEAGVSGLWIGGDPLFNARSEQLATSSLNLGLPAVYQFREFAAAGGLLSYSPSLTGTYRQTGYYVGRVLKGERPDDLPVQQSTTLEFIINLKTAKQLGIAIPSTMLTLANEVIE